MAEPTVQDEDPARAGSRQRVPVGLATVAALALGAAAYMAVGSGFVPGFSAQPRQGPQTPETADTRAGATFLALEPFMVTIPRTDPVRQLRLEIQLEVAEDVEADIRALSPRLEDTMNTYLRSIDLSDIEDPDTLLRMRMQLLRRLQVAAGEGRIKDLLVTQFLIS